MYGPPSSREVTTARFIRQITEVTTVQVTKELKAIEQPDPNKVTSNYKIQVRISYEDAKNIVERMSIAYPNDTFVAVSVGCSSFTGKNIFECINYRVYKLSKSSATATMTDDTLKTTAFTWVYDSKHMTKKEMRRDFIVGKLETALPGYKVNVFMDANGWYISGPRTARAYFEKSYESDILIVLM